MTTLTDRQVAETKARAAAIKQRLPAVMLAGGKSHQLPVRIARRKRPDHEAADRIEASYDGLQGDWRDWLDVSRRYERKIPGQDRLDFRHTLLLRLATMYRRTGKTLDVRQANRVASYCVADYYYTEAKLHRGLDCRHCPTARRNRCASHNLYAECPKIRDVISLDKEYTDSNGDTVTLADMIADDTASDLDTWLDAKTWLDGCQTRLIAIAYMKRAGIPLSDTDQRYFTRQRLKELERYQLTMF